MLNQIWLPIRVCFWIQFQQDWHFSHLGMIWHLGFWSHQLLSHNFCPMIWTKTCADIKYRQTLPDNEQESQTILWTKNLSPLQIVEGSFPLFSFCFYYFLSWERKTLWKLMHPFCHRLNWTFLAASSMPYANERKNCSCINWLNFINPKQTSRGVQTIECFWIILKTCEINFNKINSKWKKKIYIYIYI